MRLYVFSLSTHLLMTVKIFYFVLLSSSNQKNESLAILCLKLDHETLVCVLYLAMFLFVFFSFLLHVLVKMLIVDKV